MRIKDLKVTHPEYDRTLLQKYDLLYEGGHKFLEQVVMFLPQRASEAPKMYSERVKRAFYIGYVGPVIDYFTSNLFAFNASIDAKGATIDKYYTEFFENVDHKATEINQFFKKNLTEALINHRSFILVDLPRIADITGVQGLTLKDQKDLGLDKAYLVHYKAESIIDWQMDDDGNYDWVKIYTCGRHKPSYDGAAVKRHRWYIYDKTSYIIYEYDENPDKAEDPEVATARVIALGNHALPGRVPLFCMKVTRGLWVMNKLASIQTELFNLDNALAWQEYNGHYSMPVIKLKEGKDFKQKLGEAYFVKLEVDESFDWSEPEGRMMDVGLKRREMLKDELFRIIHQLSLSIKQTKSQTRQSGSSKQEDRHGTEVVLRAFGDVVRKSMQTILDWVSEARGEDIPWDVSGFNVFDMDSTTEKLAQVLQLRAINVRSATFARELDKKVANFYLEDANEDIKQKINAEIDKFDYDQIIEDPFNVFGSGNALGSNPIGKGASAPAGSTKPQQQGQKPNNTNKK